MRCYILTGGLSSRMGAPKETLVFRGSTFLDRITDAARSVFDDVVVVDRVQRQGANVLSDNAHQDVAPIFGVYRALQDAGERKDEKVWITGVDYPMLHEEILSFMMKRFEGSRAELMVPVADARPHMLCAGYSTALLPQVGSMIQHRTYALRDLLTTAASELIPEETIRSMFGTAPLRNVNTPDDYAELRRLYEKTDAHR